MLKPIFEVYERTENKKMNIVIEFIKFLIFSGLIVLVSKYILVPVLRKIAESLNLKPKTVGNIAGIATSVPELLTVSFSAVNGLIGASSYNIISSNVINLIQYLTAIFLNKNQKIITSNRALIIDVIMVAFTIIIPIFLIGAGIEYTVGMVPVLIFIFILFYFINHNTHKLYLKKKQDNEKGGMHSRNKIVLYFAYLIITAILLYIIGKLLGDTLEALCLHFGVPEFILGILLGFITSIPELITFFEAQRHHKKQDNSREGVVEATNNLLTSNILNLCIIQAIGIIIFNFIHG